MDKEGGGEGEGAYSSRAEAEGGELAWVICELFESGGVYPSFRDELFGIFVPKSRVPMCEEGKDVDDRFRGHVHGRQRCG
jgi:hypothetical protein